MLVFVSQLGLRLGLHLPVPPALQAPVQCLHGHLNRRSHLVRCGRLWLMSDALGQLH